MAGYFWMLDNPPFYCEQKLLNAIAWPFPVSPSC